MQPELARSAEFQVWVRAKASPYSIFAAQTSIETIVTEMGKRFKIENWQQNVERKGTLADLPGVPIVQLKGSPWAIAYWSVDRDLNLKRDCRTLSQKIDGRVIQLWQSDAFGWIEWLVQDKGNEREGCERIAPDGDAYLRSDLRRVPDVEDLDGETLKQSLAVLVDELLTGQALQIPAGDVDLTDERIERVDVLILPSQPLGMWDFQTSIYEGQPEYSIFAVKAPIDQVGQAVAQYCKQDTWQKALQGSARIWDIAFTDDHYWMPLIQPKDNDWTVVYWIVWDWEDSSKILKKLSKELDTFAMSLEEEDTSSAVGYKLFGSGELLERMEYGDELYFESQLREEPEFEDFEESECETMNLFINDRFIEEGIYIPTWEMEVSDEWMGRVDLIRRL